MNRTNPAELPYLSADPIAISSSASTHSRIRELCSPGQSVDAQHLLSLRPELKAEKAAVLDLAYEEYCQLVEKGAVPDLGEFCARFPFQSSLLRLLDVDRFFHENANLLADSRPIEWPEPGQSYLGFVLKCELGRGAFARVYLATETALGDRLVAVKISRQGAAEADTLGRLQHPHIVPVHSVHFDPDSGMTAICMPYLGSATLADVLDHFTIGGVAPSQAQSMLEAIAATTPAEAAAVTPSGPLPEIWNESYICGVIRIGIAVAEALEFVHSRGTFHLDLKPSNVLLSPDGQPRLLDFNLSSSRPASDLRMGGTLPYMSPEQLRATISSEGAESAAINARTDLFSLGVVLYELVAGQHPFGPIPSTISTEGLQAYLIEEHRNGPRPLRKACPTVDKKLACLVERCLAYEPSRRPQSGKEIATELRKCLPSLPGLRRWAEGHRWRVRGAAMAALLLAGAAITILLNGDPAKFREVQQSQELHPDGHDSEAKNGRINKDNEADPTSTAAIFKRGRARQQQGEMSLALLDFRAASAEDRDGKVPACAGYCLCFLKQYSEAIRSFQTAIDKGHATAATYNDLGYAYLELGKYDDALIALNQALARDSGLQAAYHNRALIHLQKALNQQGKGADEGIADVEKATRCGPGSADLFRDAASLHALAGKLEPAVKYLQQAVEVGFDPRKLRTDVAFNRLRNKPEFQVLFKLPARSAAAGKAVRLLDPVDDPR